MHHLPARLLTVVALVLLAACGNDDAATTSETTETTTVTTESTTTTTESTTTTDDGPLADAQTCTSPDGFTIPYPADWEAVADCGQFGPEPLEEPTPNTDERPGVISAYVDPVAFEDVSTAAPAAEEERTETEVDGHPAVRVETVVTEGLYPEGTRTVRWMIDVSEGSEEPRTLFVNAVDLHDDVDFDHAVEVLDAMVEQVQIDTQPTHDGAAEPAD